MGVRPGFLPDRVSLLYRVRRRGSATGRLLAGAPRPGFSVSAFRFPKYGAMALPVE